MNEKQFLHHLNFVKESIEVLKELKERIYNVFNYPLNCEDIIDMKEDKNFKIYLDVVAYRFNKIQSILGEKIFKETITLMNRETNISFIEMLNTLENEKILPSTKEWINLRHLRNSISHDYPDECEEIADTINEIFEKISFFEEIYQNIFNLYKKVKELDENPNNK